MNFRASQEQLELKDLVRRFFDTEITSAYLRKRLDDAACSDPALWAKIIELGVFELAADNSADSGFGLRELAMLASEAGRAILPENLTAALFAGPHLLNRRAREVRGLKEFLGAELFNDLAAGKRSASVLFLNDEEAAWSFNAGQGSASVDIRLAAGGADAALLAVLHEKKSGAEMLLLRCDAVNTGAWKPEQLLDRSIKRFCAKLSDVPALQLDSRLAEVMLAEFFVLNAAEIGGAAERATAMTVEYVKTRKQFDVPVGSFQAVQHRLAEMHLKCEAMNALTHFAAWSADYSKEQLPLAARAALSFALEHGPTTIESAIQLHGGIGFTWEYDLHLLLRRVKSCEALLRSAAARDEALVSLAV